MPTKSDIRAPRAFYVHVPFCQSKCLYCDFASFAGREDQYGAYFDAVQHEIHAIADDLARRSLIEPLKSLYFGGGTPSIVPAEHIVSVVDLIRRIWGFTDDAEITMEMNPGAVDISGLPDLRQCGINRLSIGLQTAEATLLHRIGRIHDLDDFILTVKAAQDAGFSNLSADLMIGLPGQTIEHVRRSVNLLIDLDIKNISFYSLIIEEGTPFYYMQREGCLPDLPGEEDERAMYELARDRLTEQGFHHYEVSNSALPTYEGRHNMSYWKGLPYAAAGLGAAAFVNDIRYKNTEDLQRYLSQYQSPDTKAYAAAVEREVITREEAKLEFFLLGFRMLDGVSVSDFVERFGCLPPERIAKSLEHLAADGLIQASGQTNGAFCERYKLTRTGLDLANFVFMEFV